ncbi:MAG: TonB-dependent receptor [Burkholderiaceae bacterium]
MPALRRIPLAMHLALTGLGGAAFAPVPAQAQAQAAAEALRTWNLPAAGLEESLNRFARQAGLTLAADPALTAGRSAPAVSGSYSDRQVLDRLLAGSGLVAVLNGDVVSIRRTPADDAAGEAAGTLPAVTVTAQAMSSGESAAALPRSYAGGQVAAGSSIGILGTQDVMNAPFSVTSYTSELIENQQARSVADVLANDPAIRMASPPGGQYQDFTIRGFYQDTMAFNGLQGLSSYDAVPTEVIERVDVIKGPTALVSGMSPTGRVGGLINLRTKRAGDSPLTRVTLGYQSDSQFGGHLDLGRRFGDDKRLGVRVNAAYRDGDTPLDGNAQRLALGSVGLDWRGERLRASLDLISQRGATKGFPRYIGFAGGVVPTASDSRLNPFYGSRYTVDTDMALGRIEYDLTPDWTVYATGGRLRSKSTYIGVNSIANMRADGSFSAPVMTGLNTKNGSASELGLSGRFRTGAVSHQLALSASHVRPWSGSNYITRPTTVSSNLYDPVHPAFSDPLPDSVWTTSITTLNSVAVADTLGLFDDHLLLTLGARHQKVASANLNQAGARTGSYDDSAVTPMLGVVYKPRTDVSVYANYIEGLSAGSTITDTTAANYGATLAPYRTKQVEAGVKWDLGRLTHTLSLFRITRPSLIKDPITTIYSADGEQRNRGIEWQFFGELMPGLRLLGGASYTQAKTMRSAGGIYDGLDAFGVARKQASLGAEWDLPAVPGLSVNARATYTDSVPLDNANVYHIPSWTRYDAGARYATRVGGKEVMLRLNVYNLFDRDYWIGQTFASGFAIRSAPRTVMLSASMDF